jgi:hypothetical protein
VQNISVAASAIVASVVNAQGRRNTVFDIAMILFNKKECETCAINEKSQVYEKYIFLIPCVSEMDLLRRQIFHQQAKFAGFFMID